MKTIYISGGNRGIGLGIAEACEKLGHTVIIGSRNLEKGRRAIKNISTNIRVTKLDINELDDIRVLSKTLGNEIGHLDVLINNAGVICGGSDAIDANMDEVYQVFETNFFGCWRMVQAFLPVLRKSTDPRIINVSSSMGALKDLVGGYAAYRLSKAAMNALTIQLSHELEGEVTVNAMCPGWVRTEMGGSNAHRSIEQGADTAVWLATEKTIPTGKFFKDRRVIPW